jgi:hypothetical protein
MPLTYKILGQSVPSTTGAVLYTVPAAGSAVISTVSVTNLAGATKTFRLLVRSGSSYGNQNYLAYDTSVLANDSVLMTLGITLSGSCQIVVSGSDTNVAFNAFGAEIT